MVKPVNLQEAQALLAAGGIDLVDVREVDEWQSGHVPKARNVPLSQLIASPSDVLHKGKILFVCRSGNRSMKAALAADAAGFNETYNLDGGTSAWAKAGFPIETPNAAEPSSGLTKSISEELANAPSCGLPDPGLDVVIGANLRMLREKRKLTLDNVAELTGLSRSVLGQIELGKTPASVSVVWKIAQAFGVNFSTLLVHQQLAQTRVSRGVGAHRLTSPDGRYSSRALYPLNDRPDVEFYEIFLAAHSREDAQAHKAGTRENLVVTSGELQLFVDGQQFTLGKSDAILFNADVPHSYVNESNQDCWVYLVMTYAI